ncbi:hypothetical protein HYT84_04875, partial [Candidatus Micrarchaeota archaeon]|nr:hypothetical protein [Candidatus Micrarchaeota archaeon]
RMPFCHKSMPQFSAVWPSQRASERSEMNSNSASGEKTVERTVDGAAVKGPEKKSRWTP